MQSDSFSPRKAGRLGRKGSVPGQLPNGSGTSQKLEGKARPKSLALKMLLAIILCIALFVMSTLVS
jgi:hypothetical protein